MGSSNTYINTYYYNTHFNTESNNRRRVENRQNKILGYSRRYDFHNYLSADEEIELVYQRPRDNYPQNREKFINILKAAKRLKKNFYIKVETNGCYYKNLTSWWVYSGDTQINIKKYKNVGGNQEKILCFPSEATKELSLAEQRRPNCIFSDGYQNYVNVIRQCERNNIPFVINVQWGNPNYFTVEKL